MEYIVLIFLYALSMLFAYFIMKFTCKFFKKCLINLLILLTCGCIICVTGLKETSLLVYLILFSLTLLGILMRIITPLILNVIGSLLAKILKQDYTWRTYEQLMYEEQSGYKMYFCVLTFTTLKIVLYMILIASLIGLI